jgi:hypothetical protein
MNHKKRYFLFKKPLRAQRSLRLAKLLPLAQFLFRSDWTLAARGSAYMKHSFRQDSQDYQDFFGLVLD